MFLGVGLMAQNSQRPVAMISARGFAGLLSKFTSFQSSESGLYFQVLSVTSLAKPCRSRLLMVLSGGGIVRLGSSYVPKNPEYMCRTGAICFLLHLVQEGFHVTLISSLS